MGLANPGHFLSDAQWYHIRRRRRNTEDEPLLPRRAAFASDDPQKDTKDANAREQHRPARPPYMVVS